MNKMRNELEKMVGIALQCLYTNDVYLITHKAHDLSGGMNGHVSERSIVARFAVYLQQQLYEHSILKDYNLDVEYNRNMDRPKNLPNTEWQDNGAFPDLIIHKRGNNCDNLLIIEFKTHWNDGEDGILKDIKKLRAFQNEPYLYENALFIKLMRNSPEGFWVSEGTTVDALTEVNNVFKDFQVPVRGVTSINKEFFSASPGSETHEPPDGFGRR